MKVERKNFKGNPILSIVDDSNEQFQTKISFGLKKAKMILENIDEIKKFIKDND